MCGIEAELIAYLPQTRFCKLWILSSPRPKVTEWSSLTGKTDFRFDGHLKRSLYRDALVRNSSILLYIRGGGEAVEINVRRSGFGDPARCRCAAVVWTRVCVGCRACTVGRRRPTPRRAALAHLCLALFLFSRRAPPPPS